ncbi:hypothetical protein SXCC_02710 [Gluconacetobacter sp. SXCC-1]|nr:hypothetical protein SXCC_02710 [Gluconacetobacter sp. SXCC-1]
MAAPSFPVRHADCTKACYGVIPSGGIMNFRAVTMRVDGLPAGNPLRPPHSPVPVARLKDRRSAPPSVRRVLLTVLNIHHDMY